VPRPEAGFGDPRDLDEPNDSLSMAAPRLEQCEHLGVVPSRAPSKRVHDLVMDMEIPDAYRVRVSPRALGDFRSCPLADTRHEPQPGQRRYRRELDALLEPTGHCRGTTDRALPSDVDAETVPVPSRDVEERLGSRRHPERRPGPGRRIAVPVAHAAPGAARLPAGDALLEDGGYEHVEDETSARQPQPGMTPSHVGKQWMRRDVEAGPVIAGTEQNGHPVQEPIGAGPPGGAGAGQTGATSE